MLMIHSNFAEIENNELIVDRKFHDGMLAFASAIPNRLMTVNPRLHGNALIMDLIRVPLNTLPYGVLLLDVDSNRQPTAESLSKLEKAIVASRLVVGQDFGATRIARRNGVPYIALIEYDLGTQVVTSTIDLNDRLRRLVRSVRIAFNYYTEQREDVKGAIAVHCNGYPTYDAVKGWNPNRLLYLDSRMPLASVIDANSLEERLSTLSKRRLRLLFSGRYEAMKGAADVISVAVECQKRGMAVELAVYGQGSQRATMQAIANTAPEPQHIQINDAVPFPELIKLSQTYDLFVCCHPQSDPSCTYLESFGAGLPIVGYANRMWRRLCAESEAGIASPLGDVASLGSAIETLGKDRGLITRMSRKAREFAVEHCAERELGKRIHAMKSALEASTLAAARSPTV